MKFKKVELQAFRAYEDKKDGTFDFLLPDGECANFISIFAPNGFGKTSFYDGVEWAITNNINRFLRREKENKGSAQAEREMLASGGKKVKQFILRNRNASSEIEGLVNVYTTKEDFKRKIPVVKRIGSSDYHFDSNETDKSKRYFLDVILTQEWIDAFIKEENGEERYNKFIKYFADSKMDTYYNNIVLLIKENDKKISDLNIKLGEYQLQLRLDIDEKLLINVNLHIKDLNSKGEKIRLIDVGFTDLDFVQISKNISDRLIELNNKKIELKENLDLLITQEAKIENYLSSKIELKLCEQKLSELKAIDKRIIDWMNLKNASTNLNEAQAKYIKTKDELLLIITMLPAYKLVDLEVKDKKAQLLKNKSSIVTKEKSLNLINDDVINISNKIANIQFQVSSCQNKIQEAPSIYIEGEKLNKQLTDLKKELSDKDKLLKSGNNISIEIENQIKELEEIQKNISNNPTNLFQYSQRPEYKEFISKIEDKIVDIEFNTKIQIENERQADEAKILNLEISKLISLGGEIINSNKSNSCPLCTHKYDSYTQLLDNITANKALSNTQKTLIQAKNDLKVKFGKLNSELLELKNSFILFVEKEKIAPVERLQKLKNETKIIADNRKQIILKIESIQEELNLHLIKTQGLNNSEYINRFSTELAKLVIEMQECNKVLKEKSDQKLIEAESLSSLNKTTKSLSDSIENLLKNDIYKIVKDFCKNNLIEEFSEDRINKMLTTILKTIEDGKLSIDSKNQEILVIEKLLVNVDEKSLKNEIIKNENLIESLKNQIALFNIFLLNTLKVSSDTDNKGDLEKLFSKIKLDISKETNEINALFQNFQKLNEYKSAIKPFLDQIILKENIKKVEQSITFNKNVVGPELYKEKDKVSEFIHKQVESYFHEDLINELYSKIDPHPEYKKIKFKCDFSDGEPRLDVFVNDINGKHPISPNLYFSAAQLNVLSLSIFLAKALHATDYDGKPVNCIFLDDPIQAMDSINILSTIDLLRSLVAKGKQIILSTHDENFHSLLQKKIPTGLFKSKYLELESFGKVKQ